MKLNEMIDRSSWECPEGCGEALWMHELFGDYDSERGIDTLACPPPPESKDCCGRLPGKETEEIRTCSKERCDAWWCVCGTFTGMSTGPVGCDCEYDRGEVSTDPPKRSS